MKKVISLALIGATSSLMAMSGEHAYLYKDPRIMGMGGANVAVGAYSTSVFSNPAGLTQIDKDHGLVVDLLGLGLSGSEKVQDFLDDIDTASDSDEDSEMIAVIDKYSGEHFHIGIDNYTSISKNSDLFAWTVGILAASDINFMTHSNGSSNGGLLETSSRVYGGVVLGAAKSYDTEIGRLDVGFGIKYITQTSYAGVLGISELIDDSEDSNVEDKLQDKYEIETSGVGVDLGAIYYPFATSSLHPAVGISVLNIGSIDMDDSYGGQPMTVNLGISITPEIPYIYKFVFAVDYVDLLNANKYRIFDYNENEDVVSYTDYEDADIMKRLRVGVGMGLVDTSLFSLGVNAGLYQGAYTAGLNMDFLLLKFNFATYEEQIGVGDVEIADRRYMAKLAIGW